MCVLSCLAFAPLAQAQFVLAEWNFPNNPDDAVVDNTSFPANSAKVIATFGGPVIGFGLDGFTTKSAGNNGWNGGSGAKGWEVEISTAGQYNIQLSSKQASSNTGPRDWRLQYRVPPSATWVTVVDVPAITGNTVWTTGRLNAIELPVACENNASLFLRWVMRSNTDVQGNTVASGGTSRIDDIVIVANSTDHFRTLGAGFGTGNWHDPAIWEVSTTGAPGTWGPTTYSPSHYAQTITIRNGDAVTITANAFMDQLTIEDGGTLDYAGGVQDLRNGAGVDMQVNGTFIDGSASVTTWGAGATWALGTTGTYIKSSGTTAANWQNNYEGGIGTVPPTANWVLRKVAGANPPLTTSNMFYPNLVVENMTAGNWNTTAGSTFQGGAVPPVILGDLDLGGTGTGTVTFFNNQTNATAIAIHGDLITRAGSTFSIGTGTGVDLRGDVLCDGQVTYGASGQRRITFHQGNAQMVSGTGTFNAYNLTVDKSPGDVTLGMSVSVFNNLNLLSGRILGHGTPHVVTLSTTATVTGASNNSFITGKVRKRGNVAFSFPVGKGGDMQPIAMSAVPVPVVNGPVWQEDFSAPSGNCASGCLAGGYTTNRGTWTVSATGANGVTANKWYISSSYQCAGSGNTLHISTDAGGVCGTVDCGAFYNDGATAATDIRAESPPIDLTGVTITGIDWNETDEGVYGSDQTELWAYNGSAWVLITADIGWGFASTCATSTGSFAALTTALSNVPNARIGFRWTNNGNGATGPTGRSVALDNIVIRGTQSDESFVAEYFHIDPEVPYNDIVNAPLDHISQCEYWTLDREIGTHPRNVTLSWDANSCGVTDPSHLRVAHFDVTVATPSWFDRGNTGTTGTTAAGTVTSGPNTLFGPFTLSSISDENPLPITLVGFHGRVQGGDGLLFWTTGSERNNAWFDVFASAHAHSPTEEWVTVGRLPGAGDSQTPLHYSLVDGRPGKRGVHYYRLKQTDHDGMYTFSDVIALDYGLMAGPVVFPNPFAHDAVVSMGLAGDAVVQLTVMNTMGQEVARQAFNAGGGTFTAQLGGLVPAVAGVYFLAVENDGQRSVLRLVRE